MTGVYLTARAVQARTWRALALAPVHDWNHAWHLTQDGRALTVIVLCAPPPSSSTAANGPGRPAPPRHRHHHPRARQHPATRFGFSAYPYDSGY
jgi:hypothetical protein